MDLKQAREAAGLTQRGLDKAAKVIAGTTHGIETGRNQNPSHETCIKITRALRRCGLKGVTSEQLFPVPEGKGAAA